MRIRRAVPDDAPSIAKCIIMAESELIARMFKSEDPETLTRALTPLILSPAPTRYSLAYTLVADADGRTAGAAISFPADAQPMLDIPLVAELNRHGHALRELFFEGMPGTQYLSNMGVEPAFRRRGIGSRLMAACEDEGRRLGFARASLLVSKEKDGTRELYGRAGYEVAGDALIAGEAYWRMTKDLSRAVTGTESGPGKTDR